MDLTPAIAVAFAASLSAPLLLALLRRCGVCRYRAVSRRSLTDLAREYRPWQQAATLAGMLLIALTGIPLWLLLDQVYSDLLARTPATYVIGLPPVIWALPAFLCALFLAEIQLRYLLCWRLGSKRYAEYIDYGNRKYDIDAKRLLSYLGAILIPLSLLLTALALDTYARVDSNGFTVNRFFGFGEKVYRLSELAAVELIGAAAPRPGEFAPDSHYVLRFSDGEVYDFVELPNQSDISRQQEIVDYLLGFTGLEVNVDDPYSA